MATFDLLIRNALIADGTGADTYFGDLGISDGRIAAIGESLSGDARETINAEGAVLATGSAEVVRANEEVIEAYLGTGLKNRPQAGRAS